MVLPQDPSTDPTCALLGRPSPPIITGKVLLDFTGTKKTHTLSKNEGEQRVTITIQKDRAIKFYINGKLKQTAKASVPASVFPVDFEISSADSRGPSVLGSWVGARRLSHLSSFHPASRMGLTQDPSTDPKISLTQGSAWQS